MLALMGAANDGGGAVLVFDEVDAGIGGHTACAVGEQLRSLAEGRQVVCITHLPQVASLANRHFSIAKDVTREPAITTVTELAEKQVVGELVPHARRARRRRRRAPARQRAAQSGLVAGWGPGSSRSLTCEGVSGQGNR